MCGYDGYCCEKRIITEVYQPSSPYFESNFISTVIDTLQLQTVARK